MMPTGNTDYRGVFTELIKKQIVVLGPDITLAKVKNVPGLEVDAQGNVTKVEGDPQVLLQNLINQFVELSGLIVKKTMESILSTHPDGVALQSQMGMMTGGIASSPSVAPVSTPSSLSSSAQVIPPTQTPISQIAPSPLQESPVQAPVQAVQAPVQNTPIQPAPNEDINELNKMLADMDSTIKEAQATGGAK